ncbi:unnamed protein product [Pleuronectes platessa]|uniref:Uncharacterized protein n=1 Tax=Pleuronectes platessa TaxID=8262 RepID=A0A9N7TW87_PLEPL|nr:unnamed protein product [Pleuronectes platessa]
MFSGASRSGVECLFVEQGGKKMGGGNPLKISSRSCFVKVAKSCERGGSRKRESGGNRVHSVWVWVEWLERESERRTERERRSNMPIGSWLLSSPHPPYVCQVWKYLRNENTSAR